MAFNLFTNILPKPRRPSCLRREGQRCRRRMSKQRLYRNVADVAASFDSRAFFPLFYFFFWFRHLPLIKRGEIRGGGGGFRGTIGIIEELSFAGRANTEGEIYRLMFERTRDGVFILNAS